MKSLLMFVAGLTIGAGISWVYNKNEYEERVQDEVEELRNAYKSKRPTKEKSDKPIVDREHESVSKKNNYEDIINKKRYNTVEVKDDKKHRVSEQTIIKPEEFGELGGYDTDTYYIYKDRVIADDRNDTLSEDEILDIFGFTIDDIYGEFGKYDDSSVYIRNSKRKTDYEILLDEENFE